MANNPSGLNKTKRPDGTQNNAGWTFLPSQNNSPVPEMPKAAWYLGDGREWSVRAQALWQRLWHSPQSTQWIDVHTEILARYLLLHERMWLESDVTGPMMNSLKAIETELGLTPRAMRNLNWFIGEAPEAAPTLAPVRNIKTSGHPAGRRDLAY